MKKYLLLGAMAVLAGCATTETETADVDTVTKPAPAPIAAIEPGSQADFEANANHRVFFGYDQHTLTPQAQSVLRRQAAWMAENPNVRLRLEGNADERGTREYNLALGARRAEAAKAYLVSLGVNAGRITTVSNGKEKPISTGSSESSWSRNRNSTTLVASN
ncbi:MAG: peptidoglycan-associated lipoprotein Pal [Pseudomonadota bacterium]